MDMENNNVIADSNDAKSGMRPGDPRGDAEVDILTATPALEQRRRAVIVDDDLINKIVDAAPTKPPAKNGKPL
jgi:hypothetical protein